MERPQVGTDRTDLYRGSGKLGTGKDYLINDPASYMYNELKMNNNKYLRDDKWAEAALRNDTASLSTFLQKRAELDKQLEEQRLNQISGTDTTINTQAIDASTRDREKERYYWDKYLQAPERADYDTYKLTLELPFFDNTDKSKEEHFDQTTHRSLGTYTEREWAEKVLDYEYGRIDAELDREAQESRLWIAKFGVGLGAALVNVGAGVMRFMGDVINLIEGVYNTAIGFVEGFENLDIGQRFLAAFADDGQRNWYDFFSFAGKDMSAAAYAIEYDMLPHIVDPREAYKNGYNRDEWNYGAGKRTTWGNMVAGAMDSIGYMLPSMALGGLSALAVKNGVMNTTTTALASKLSLTGSSMFFYTGIFSGEIHDTLESALANGVSLEDINPAAVMTNALIKSALQYAVEVGLAKVLGASGLDKAIGTAGDAASKAITSIGKTGWGAFGRWIANVAKGGLKEGLEEVCQDLTDNFTDLIFSGITSPSKYGDKVQIFTPELSIETLATSAVAAFITSFVTSGAGVISHLISGKREIGVDSTTNQIYKLGLFQTLNFEEACQAMEQWKEVLADEKASQDEKAKAAYCLGTTIDALGSVFKTMSDETNLKLNSLLKNYADKQLVKKELQEKTNQEYVDNIYDDFISKYSATKKLAGFLIKKGMARKLPSKKQLSKSTNVTEADVKKALLEHANVLKKNGVTSIKSIITPDDFMTLLPKEDEDRLKPIFAQLLNDSKSVLVGVDGAIVEKSGDIYLVPENLIESGNTIGLINATNYLNIRKALIKSLNKNQQELLLSTYKQVIGNSKATLEDAIDLLIGSPEFYAKMILLSGERGYKLKAIQAIATLDQVIKEAGLKEVSEGGLNQKAYLNFLQKVRDNMKAGIIAYATKFEYLNVDEISDEILPPDIKKAIREDKNNIVRGFMNSLITSTMSTKEQYARYDAFIDRFTNLSEQERNQAKAAIRSKNANSRLDAEIFLARLITMFHDSFRGTQYSGSKLTYLPDDGSSNLAKDTIIKFEQIAGIPLNDLVAGKNLDKLTSFAQNIIKAKGYDINEPAHRGAIAREIMYPLSYRQLSVSDDGTLLRVLKPQGFIKAEYLGVDGDKKLQADLRAGKILFVKDIVSTGFKVPNCEIVYDPKLADRGMAKDNKIYLSSSATIETVCHELTHITQALSNTTSVGDKIIGATTGLFDNLPDDVKANLEEYVKENFPLSYSVNEHADPDQRDFSYTAYAIVNGELQANARTVTNLFDLGFRWKDDYSTLISPDGQHSWSMMQSKDKVLKETTNALNKKNRAVASTREDIANAQKPTAGKDFAQKLPPKGSSTISGKKRTQHKYSGRADIIGGLQEQRGSQSDIEKLTKLQETGGIKPISNIIEKSSQETKKSITDTTGFKITKLSAQNRQKRYVGKQIHLTEDLANSNKYLKGYRRKGLNNWMDEGVKNFIIAVTDDEIMKQLPTSLQQAIKTYTLDKNWIIHYIATASNMDETTMQYLAKYVYNNSELADLKLDEYKSLMDETTLLTLATLSKFAALLQAEKTDNSDLMKQIKKNLDTSTKLSYDELIAWKDGIYKLIQNDKKLLTLWKKAEKSLVQKNREDIIINTAYLPPLFFRLFDGSIDSIRSIYNYAKSIEAHQRAKLATTTISRKGDELEIEPEADITGSSTEGDIGLSTGSNWIDKMYEANIEYEYALPNGPDTISTEDKIKAIKDYTKNAWFAKLANMSAEEKAKYTSQMVLRALDRRYMAIEGMSDEEINAKYAQIVAREATDQVDATAELADWKSQPSSRKNIREATTTKLERLIKNINNKEAYDALPDALKDYITYRNSIAKLKPNYLARTEWQNLPSGVKEFIVWKDYKPQIKSKYTTMTKEEYDALPREVKAYIGWNSQKRTPFVNEDQLTLDSKTIKTLGDLAVTAKASILAANKADKAKIKAEAQLNEDIKKTLKKKSDKLAKEKAKLEVERLKFEQEKKSFKSRVDNASYFNYDGIAGYSDNKPSNLALQLLETEFGKNRMSTVQKLTNNTEKDIANSKNFYERNAETILNASLGEIEEAVNWFLNVNPEGIVGEYYDNFMALRLMFLGFVNGQTGPTGIFRALNDNLKQKIEHNIKKVITQASTVLSTWQQVMKIVDPLKAMASADIRIGGVSVPQDMKDNLFKAINEGELATINGIISEITKYVNDNKTEKKSFAEKAITFRAMSMLSSPLTWLRNLVSNMIIKPLNRLSSAIGNRIFTGHTQQGQYLLNKQVTPEIQKYINDTFIDSGLFDTLVKNISKYNPSDIIQLSDSKTKTKEQIIAKLVLKSMYGQYYNTHMFDGKMGEKLSAIYSWLMERMSDDNFVREAAIRYFGKILAEHSPDLSVGVTDSIMNDFSAALGLALADYMHSDNFFNDVEKAIKTKSEGGWFVYKMLLPFASASWNWFKAAINLTPVGLVNSIRKFIRLENQVTRAEIKWADHKNQIDPRLTEYKIRRDIGQGIIGTIGFLAGIALAALGIVRLDDDDYGIPKIRIADAITLDVSNVFGSSSILAGMALVMDTFQKKRGILDGLNSMSTVLLDNMPLMDLLQIDMYSSGPVDFINDYLQQSLLSYIPNGISWIAGGFYGGTIKKDSFFARAVAKVPVLNTILVGTNVIQKNINPFTGKTGSYLDAINRLIPYLSIEIADLNERKTTNLGLNKSALRGQYTINGKDFKVSGKELTDVNKAYGSWNAKDLTDFYANKTKVKVKVGNVYQTLSYNQMTNEQRKNAAQNIMSNNAELAKIKAWTDTGNKYYTSEETYMKLKAKGVKNIYVGNKGFVAK